MSPKKIALYIRSATGNEDDLFRQKRTLEKFVGEHVDFVRRTPELYCDPCQSGLKDGPELVRLFKDLQDGVCDGVVVTKLNRISRSGFELMRFYDLVKAKRFRFVSVMENIDSIYWPSAGGEA